MIKIKCIPGTGDGFGFDTETGEVYIPLEHIDTHGDWILDESVCLLSDEMNKWLGPTWWLKKTFPHKEKYVDELAAKIREMIKMA